MISEGCTLAGTPHFPVRCGHTLTAQGGRIAKGRVP